MEDQAKYSVTPATSIELLADIDTYRSARSVQGALRAIDFYVQSKIDEHMKKLKQEFNAHWTPCTREDVLTEGSYLIRLQHGTTVWYKDKKVYKGQHAKVSHLCAVAYMVIPEFNKEG